MMVAVGDRGDRNREKVEIDREVRNNDEILG